jgi:hypothetical protein
MKRKYYCYVDETGQDTKGKLFLVGVLVVEDKEKATLWADRLNKLKKRIKWHGTKKKNKIAFLEALSQSSFPFKSFVSVFKDCKDYFKATLEGISKSLKNLGKERILLFFDGKIHKKIRLKIGVFLHCQKIKVKKVRGINIKKEPLIEIIDAIVGAVREKIEGEKEIAQRVNILVKNGNLKIFK